MCLQYWMYSKQGEIRRDETCLDYSGHDVVLYPCHGAKGNQLWLYDPNVSKIMSNRSLKLIKNINLDLSSFFFEVVDFNATFYL